MENIKNIKHLRVVVDVPPPFPTAEFHVGHWLQYSSIINRIDLLRALGAQVNYKVGFDVNGIPISLAAVRKIKTENSTKSVLDQCHIITNGNIESMLKSFKRLGYSTDDYYTTRDSDYVKLEQEYLQILEKNKLLSYGSRLSRYCVNCRSFLSASEVSSLQHKVTSYWIQFPVDNLPPITVWTTRPELLGSVEVLCYNRSDQNYIKYKNQSIWIPFAQKYISIIESDRVNPEIGTGIEFIASFGSLSDAQILRQSKMVGTNHINLDGLISTGSFKGLTVTEAEAEVENQLIKFRLNYKTQRVKTMRECHMQRGSCQSRVQYILSDQVVLKLKQADKSNLIKLVEEYSISNITGGKALSYSLRNYRSLTDWIKLHDDWCLSRQYTFGNPLLNTNHVCDGWVDSSLSHIYLARHFDCNSIIRIQGADILLTWYFCSLVTQNYWNQFTNSSIKFMESIFTPLVVGDDGLKMSKSKQNYKPQSMECLTTGSADLVRLWSTSYNLEKPFLKVDFNGISLLSKFLKKLENLLNIPKLWIMAHVDVRSLVLSRSVCEYTHAIVIDSVYNMLQCKSNPLLKVINLVNRMLSNQLVPLFDTRPDSNSDVLVSITLVLNLIQVITPDVCKMLFEKYSIQRISLSEIINLNPSFLKLNSEELGEFISTTKKQIQIQLCIS